MLNIFIPSKDRAAQLDILLDSFYTNLPNLRNCSIYILYTFSNNDYATGYNILNNEWKNKLDLVWFEQNEFKPSFLKCLKDSLCSNRLVLGLTDDTWVYRYSELTQDDIEEAFTDRDLLCISLRLGKNTTIQDCSNNTEMGPFPVDSYKRGQFNFWDYKNQSINTNYGYGISIDGHIYRILDLIEISEKCGFSNLRDWEGSAVYWARDNFNCNTICCPELSVTVNVPINMTQFPYNVNVSPYKKTLQDLNDKYLQGQRFRVNDPGPENIIGSHQLLQLVPKNRVLKDKVFNF